MAHLLRAAGEAFGRVRDSVRAFFAPTHRKAIAGVVLAVLVLGVLYVFHPAIVAAETAKPPADVGIVDKLLLFLGGIFLNIASGIGSLVTILVDIIVAVLQYNKFSTSPIVSAGWAVVRDSINMFYVILLIAIAFGTIIGYHKFNWSQQVPRLLRWAIIINFSKTLCGLAIDGSQVVTLTFANAIKDIAGGNFVTFLGLTSVLSFSDSASFTNPKTASGTPIAPGDYFFASIMACVMFLIVLGVLVALLVILVFRIVMLWILITISPLTWFVGSAKGIIDSKAYSQWWDNFKCFLVIGPVLTFFLWLALSVAGAGNIAASEGFAISDTNTGLLNQIFDMPRLTSFVIGLAIIWAGFDTANTFCGSVQGGVVQKALGKARGFSKAVAGAPLKFGFSVGKGVGNRIPLVGSNPLVGPSRNKIGSKLARGAQTVTRQVPGFLGGAALTQKLGEQAEHLEHNEHEVAAQQAKRSEDLGKAFATDKQKMSFMKQAAELSEGGKKSTRFAGNEDAILGNLKKAVTDKDFRKELEESGVNVGNLLQAYDHDIEHKFGHADEKFAAAYKDFKKKESDYFVPQTKGPDGKVTYDFGAKLKDADAVKGYLNEDNIKRIKKMDEKNGTDRFAQLQAFVKDAKVQDSQGKDQQVAAMLEDGKYGKDMAAYFRPDVETLAKGFKNGEFENDTAQKQVEANLKADPYAITKIPPEALASNDGNNGATRAMMKMMGSGKQGGGSELLFAGLKRGEKKTDANLALQQMHRGFSGITPGKDKKADEAARKFYTSLAAAGADYTPPEGMAPIEEQIKKFAAANKKGEKTQDYGALMDQVDKERSSLNRLQQRATDLAEQEARAAGDLQAARENAGTLPLSDSQRPQAMRDLNEAETVVQGIRQQKEELNNRIQHSQTKIAEKTKLANEARAKAATPPAPGTPPPTGTA